MEERSTYSRQFQLSDGSRRLEVFLQPINYKDPEGSWQPIDAQLSASGKTGFAFENTANSFASYFSDEAGRRGVIRVQDGAFSLELSPLETTTPTGLSASSSRPAKDQLEYLELFPSTTARYTVMPGAVKEELVLAGASAPATFRFRIEAENLFPVAQKDGSIIFFDTNGRGRFVLLQPWAVDSALDAETINLEHSISPDGKGYLYQVVMDPKWLADPARVFPVVIDPTITTEELAQDTYINSSQPNTNYSTSAYLYVQSALGTSGQRDALVRFNLPELENNPAIMEASISLYKVAAGAGTNTVQTYQITSDWTNSVTWNTRPTYASTPDSETSADGDAGWYTFDMTDSAVQWYEEGAANYGVELVATGSGASGNSRQFRSGNSTSNYPSMTITYSYEDPRHSTYDLGEFAGHHAEATLDTGQLQVEVTDLAIASWGPSAAISRHYATGAAGANFAPGWIFNFEQALAFASETETQYTDQAGQVHVFVYNGSAWQPPAGMVAALEHVGSTWTLTLKDRSVLTFDSAGKLAGVADRNGNREVAGFCWTARETS